jgi:DNA-nicking Smr family endonuclease
MTVKMKRHRVTKPRKPRARAPIDDTAAEELELFAENTGELYPQKQAILANIKRKLKRGKYDPAKAPKLWMYWVDNAAKRYQKEFGSESPIFNKPTREAVAQDLAKRYHSGEE